MGSRLGIETSAGVVYEPGAGYWREVWLPPVVSMAAFITGDQKAPVALPELAQAPHVFREDSFDATTRIRRGRFYRRTGDPNPTRARRYEGQDTHPWLQSFVAEDSRPTAPLVAIGVEDSLWRILSTERISTGEWLVTLKARGGAGLLPDVDADKVPELGRVEVVKAVDHMVDVAHRETPGSIVDVARNTAALLMGVCAAGLETDANKQGEIRHKDLGKVCAHFEGHPTLKTQEVAISTGRI